MTSEEDCSPPPTTERGDAVSLSRIDGVSASCKRPQASRRRRLELRRQRSGGSSGHVRRNRVSKESSDSSTSDSDKNAEIRSSAGEILRGSVGIGERGTLPCVSHSSVSLIGRRREMEDAVTVAPAFMGPAYDFFGVYDGHGGARVALKCQERMHVVLAEEAAESRTGYGGGEAERWREALAACFSRVDGEMAEDKVAEVDMTVGSTAVVALIGASLIVVANCGDSRAVLSRGGVAVALSSDHKPNRADELERVEAAGGRVINWDGYRVLGVLATSRSIGDHYLRPYIISEPEVAVINRDEKDEFLILASDGLWDVMSNEVACWVTRQCLTGRATRNLPGAVNGRTTAEAAALLAELALSQGSRDNISVVVVQLKRLGAS